MLNQLVNFLFATKLSSIFFSKFQISTNYENVILNFVVLSIALARQGTSFNGRKGNTSYKKRSKGVHFVLAERKRLFLEPPKTSFFENRLISLTSDVICFQRFHCIILESSQEWTKGLYLPCYPIRYLVCPVEVPLCEMKVN